VPYLDWGGAGPALVFVPGFGNTAHVFDTFAPRLTDRFRAVGVGRVGVGDAEPPPNPTPGGDPSAHGLASRVAQLRAVLDTLGLARAVLVGHSLGGDEITAFARAHPERTAGLVYLDAAYDHVEALRQQRQLAPFFAGAPAPGPADRADARAYQAFTRRLLGVELPLGEVLATMRVDASGAVLGPRTPGPVLAAGLAAVRPLDYAGVRAPALALYADWVRAADLLPWLAADPAADARATAVLRQSLGPWQQGERARFARAVPGARVAALRAHHYLFLSHPAETERHVRAFVATLPARGR
jgi:pimeloyl-ACP methyl ester carboxylesterase